MSIKKDPGIEEALSKMNELFASNENDLLEAYSTPEFPIIFVIGSQRSGTTILTQTLASLFNISYPSNLIARFWRFPYFGNVLQNSLSAQNEPIEYSSSHGATQGLNGPHEFSYFWKHWFPNSAKNAQPYLPTVENQILLQKHLAAWQKLNDTPLFFKNLLEVIPNIKHISKILPTAYFIHIKREDLFVIQSTYESRKNYANDYNSWFGVKPSNYEQIMKNEDILLQITEQVYFVKKEIEESLLDIPSEKFLTIDYEDLVTNPSKVIEQIENKCNISNWRNEKDISQVDLRSGNKLRLSSKQVNKINSHLQELNK